MCDCSATNKWVEGTRKDSRFSPMKELLIGDWCYLVKCQECNQLWQVDAWDKYWHGIAIKYFGSAKEWIQISGEAIRKEIIIGNYGGISDKLCQWHRCKEKALSDLAFCVDCAYDKNGIRW
jgi:hypothetical protein